MNERGELIRRMWDIQPTTSNSELKEVVYGLAPRGWKDRIPPEPLEIGKLYTVHYTFFFRIVRVGESVEAKEFVRKGSKLE